MWEKLGLIESKEDDYGLPYKTSDSTLNGRNAEKLITNVEACKELLIFIDDFATPSMSNIRSTARITIEKKGWIA